MNGGSVVIGAVCFIAGVLLTLLVTRHSHRVHVDWRLRIDTTDSTDTTQHDEPDQPS